MDQAIAQKKIELKLDMLNYTGDDPLKLMFEYLIWLDEKYGRQNCQKEFNLALEETLTKFYFETKYYNDDRYVKLVVFYSEVRGNPEEIFSTIYEKGIGLKSSQFYECWANEYCKKGNFSEADKIFNLGFSNNAVPKSSLENFYKQFLQTIGKKYLCGELVDNNERVCSKCSQKIEEKEVEEKQEEAVKHWEMNPLDTKNKDDFECPVSYPDPEDPKKLPMYPKNQVYVDGKEFSIEELKAVKYLKRIIEIERQLAMEAANEISAKKIKKADESTNFDAKKDRSSSIQRSNCYGDITKEAMDVIQEMWNSPGIVSVDKFKENGHKKALDILSDNTPVRPEAKKSMPFTIYTEDSMAENHPPCNKTPSVTKQVAVPKPNLLSERKAEPIVERTTTARQLPFQPAYANNGLAQKMSLATIDNKPIVDEEDTCNTKAFAFTLPSSTPVQLKKSQNQPQEHNGSYLEEGEDKNEKVDTKLSVIMEASKEKYNSSSSSNGSNPRCNGINKVSEIMRPLKFESVDNPFSRDLNEWFLSQMNFPLSHQSKNYHKSVANIPAMNKTVVLGDQQTYSIINEIGKGAYARIMRAKANNKDYALKVEKPACNWEYYIANEIKKRVDPKMKSSFVDIESAFVYKNGSVLRMDWAQYGTLLSLVTEYKQKTGKFFSIVVTLHFAIEMIDIIHALHKTKIIHGDIKPDNFVIKHLPAQKETQTCIQLIDFGRSIDMTLFHEGIQFKYVVNTDGFQCNEMKENKPWTYQTDLYGLAGSLYCLLAGNYMKVIKKNDEWKLLQLLPRNAKREVWDPIFKMLLNAKSSDSLNDLLEIKSVLQREIDTVQSQLVTMNFQQFQNVVNGS